MAKWIYTLPIKTEWQQAQVDEITVQQLASVVAKKLAKIDFNDEDINFNRDEFVDEFEGFAEDLTASRDDFDNIMQRLYDFADEYRLWIKTF